MQILCGDYLEDQLTDADFYLRVLYNDERSMYWTVSQMFCFTLVTVYQYQTESVINVNYGSGVTTVVGT